MVQDGVFAVGVVGVVVRLTIAEPAGVGIMSGDVIWMGSHKHRLDSSSSYDAFRTVMCSADNVTLALTSPKVDKLSQNHLPSVAESDRLQSKLAWDSCQESSCIHCPLQRIGQPSLLAGTLWTWSLMLVVRLKIKNRELIHQSRGWRSDFFLKLRVWNVGGLHCGMNYGGKLLTTGHKRGCSVKRLRWQPWDSLQ